MSENQASRSYDEPRNIQQKTQAKWENQPYVATADYHFALAQAYSSEGRVERAIEEYRAALAYDSSSAVIHAKIAGEYLKKGSTSFAIEECKRAIELDPNYIEVRLMLGGIYSLSNEIEKALQEYDAILKLDTKNDEAAVFKTQLLVEQDRIDEALKFIHSFIVKVKDSAAAWFYAGKLEHSKGNGAQAIKSFRVALELRPGFAQATLALGVLFEAHNEINKAIEVYEEQMEQRQDVQVAGRLATLYLKKNELDSALKVLETMAAIDPEDMNTQLKVGLIEMQKQEWEKSRKIFESILVKVPESDKVNYYLAAVLEEQGKFQSSIDHLLKVMPDSSLFEDANLHAAALFQKLLQGKKAHEVLKAAIQKSPENASFYLILASLYEDDHAFKDATETLAQGLKIFPEHEKMRYFYGALLDKQGKQDEAVVEMEKIITQNPDFAEALNFIAYTWTSQGVRLHDAEEMLKRALKLKPQSAFILDSLGWNQFMLGKNQNAMVYLEKAASLKADEQAILEHLVEVYAKNQMPERAQAIQLKIKNLASDPVASAGTDRAPASVDQK